MTWRRVGLGLGLVALVAAGRVLPVQAWIAALQTWVSGLGVAGAILYGLVYVAAAVLFLPGSVLTIGAGLVFGIARGTLLVSVASTTAAALAFLIARYVARARIERMAKANPRFEAIDRAIGQGGWRVVALLRLSPLIPYSLSNYIYGLTAIPFGPYVMASWIAMLPGTLLYVYLGAAGGAVASAAGRSALEWALFAAGLLATLLATVFVTRAARREVRKIDEAGP